MKKWMIGLLVAFAGFCAFAQGDIKDRISAARVSGDTQAVLALVNEAGSVPHLQAIYLNAMLTRPKSERITFAKTTVPERYRARCLAVELPRGREANAALTELYKSRPHLEISFANKFNAAVATREECIEFYEAVLKNVELNESTKGFLGQIKGNLLKLKDI
jgi:hypothetical protein